MSENYEHHKSLPPHQWHSDTSTEAAEKITRKKFEGRVNTIFRAIGGNGVHGLTDEEGQHTLNIEGNSYRPCRIELVKRGLVEDSDDRRKTVRDRNAVVWTLTQKGLEVYEAITKREVA